MDYAIKRDGAWVELFDDGFQSGEGEEAVNHPPGWLAAATRKDLAAAGVREIVEAEAVPAGQRAIGLVLVDRGGEPAFAHVLEPIDVATAREAAWAAAKAYRDQRERAGAPTPHGFFDADIQSRANVAGAALGALRSQLGNKPFAVTFTRWDNTPVDLDATAMGEVGDAVLLYVAQVHEAGVAIRAAIEAAGDAAAVGAVDITDGYPPAAADQ